MASTLRLVNPGSGKQPISFPEFLQLLGTRQFDRVEAKVRRMREEYRAPEHIPDHDAYRDALFNFYVHMHRSFYGGEFDPWKCPNIVWEELQRLYKQNLHGVERDAILNRNRGFIGIIDDMTDALVKQHLESHIQLVFFDYLPTDQEVHLRLAKELAVEINHHFPHDDQIREWYMLAGNIQETIKTYALQLHSMRQEWQW